MTLYKVTVSLNDETLKALKAGFYMQVYKGVKSQTADGALPTVWFTVDSFSSNVVVHWSENYGGYFSNTKVRNGVTVDTSTSDSMNAGDVIILHDDGSASVSTTGGKPGTFSFKSEKKEAWTSGLMVAPEGQALAPVCAFPQYGAVGNVIMPYQKVLLLFSQDQLDTGSVVETAFSESVSITLGTSLTELEVGFDINKGWDTKGSILAKVNPQDFALAPDLIVPAD